MTRLFRFRILPSVLPLAVSGLWCARSVWWLAVFAGTALAQISPGPLSKAHKDLEGPLKCSQCHTFGAAKKFKCTGCHGEIKRRVAAGSGYHGRVVKRAAGDADCTRCHTEHYGRDFSIVKRDDFGPDRFDHREAGFPLVGAHTRLACQKCHNPKMISAAERASIKVRDLTRTYLGMGTQCVSCHLDFHKGQLGSDCVKCHSQTTWKASKDFDHTLTKYPLTGLHARVDCAKCHKPGEAGGVRYKGLEFASCSNCHNDPHRGAFQSSGTCASCHNVNGWKQVKMTSSAFDHSLTKFPLKGRHGAVACLECHKNSNFKQAVPHVLCMDCHKDKHGGEFVTRADKGDCGSCHNEVAYKPALFTKLDHDKTLYPLRGKHAGVACGKCHLPAGAATKYKIPFNACSVCHKDAHLGQFAGPPHGGKCESCHTEDGFRPATYTLTRHQDTKFPLTGSHMATPCDGCHKPAPGQVASTAAIYHFAALDCTACHNDPHGGQFRAVTGAAAPRTCESCHTTRTWKDLPAFDHSKTNFELLGAHRAVACTECHWPANLGINVKNVIFRGAPTECAKCHEDVHAGQFASDGATRCETCHTAIAWRVTTFDHEKSIFPLTGLHRQVPCRDCHKPSVGASLRPVVMYKPTPRRCASCHAGLNPER